MTVVLEARVDWNEKAMALVHPRREDGPQPPRAVPDLWARLCKIFEPYRGAFTRGLEKADAGSADVMRRVLEVFEGRAGGVEPPLDVEVEAALSVLLGVTRRAVYGYDFKEQEAAGHYADALIADWTRHAGLDFAVRAVVAAARWEVEREYGSAAGVAIQTPGDYRRHYADSMTLYLKRPEPYHWQCGPHAFLALRRAVASAGADQYRRARDAAGAIRQQCVEEYGSDFAERGTHDVSREMLARAALYQRCNLAYAFEGEPWWREDIAACFTVPTWFWMDACAPLVAAVRDADLATRLAEHLTRVGGNAAGQVLAYLPTMICNLGPAAADGLIVLLDNTRSKDLRQGVAQALALIESPRAAERLAPLLIDVHGRAIASQYFLRAPALAARALLPHHMGGRGEMAEAATMVLSRVSRSAPTAMVHPDLDEAQREALQALCTAVDDARPDELPEILAAPPWAAGKAMTRKAPPVVAGLQPVPGEETMEWQPGEREMILARSHRSNREYYRRVGTLPQDLSQFDPESTANHLPQLLLVEDEAGARTLLERFPPEAWEIPHMYRNEPAAYAAAFDFAFLPPLLRWSEQRLGECAHALVYYVTPRVAPLLARALYELKTVKSGRGYPAHKTQPVRPVVHRWMLAHPQVAVNGMIPTAVGPLGPSRDACEAALRFLASAGHDGAIRAAAQAFGKEAAAAVDEILAFDPMRAFPAKLPKMPSWWNPAELPRPLLSASRHALPLSALQHLGTMLAFSALYPPYPGIAQVAEACDEKSLDAFAWALFQTWVMEGAPPKDNWALMALGHLGSDDMARRLAPYLRAWPREGGQQRAVLGLDVLALIGSDVALRVLFGIAERGRKALKEKARQRVEELANLRGLSAEDLADRLIEDFDLDEDGSCTLDFGPRQFRVGFDADLQPYVTKLDGDAATRLRDLPAAASDDDKELAAAAIEQWKRIKKEARKVITAQTHRLELALCGERRWPLKEFLDNLADHPLLLHLVRRLVWGVFDEEDRLVSAFRLCEDSSLANESDVSVPMPTQGKIGLVHPLHLAPEQVQAWKTVITDYQIIQPFQQVSRPVHVPKEDERAGTRLQRVEGRTTTVARLLGLEHRGWRKGGQYRKKHSHEMVVVSYDKPLANGEYFADLRFSPGFDLGTNQGTMTLGAVEFRPAVGGRFWRMDDPLLKLGEVPPVAFSEVVADLETLKPAR